MMNLFRRWYRVSAEAVRRRPLLWISCAAGVLLLLLFFPLPRALRGADASQTVRILDRNGALLYEYRNGAPGSNEWLPYERIPASAVDALIAVEDRTFLTHPGVSLRGILRAAWQNVTGGRIVSGGSTLTQQLVRILLQQSNDNQDCRGIACNAPTGRNRSYVHKIFEAYYALRLDARMSKQEILEAYLNSAYFGHQAYGLQAAATTYFGKSAGELSLAETSLLIGLLQSPAGFDPFRTMPRARERQAAVLKAMREQGVITAGQEAEASAAAIRLAPDRVNVEAPHFVFQLLAGRDIPPGARELTTTLDLGLQHAVERSIEKQMEALRDKNVTSAAVVVLDAVSGDILAMAGSADYFDAEHDGAVNVAVSPRQPGSALKPFTYALAFENGATAATTVADVETQFFTQEGNPYVPRNYDYGYHGLVRYREALGNSYNIAAVKVLERVGIGNLLHFLRELGLTSLTETPEHYGLALTLGDPEVSLLELTRAYAAFARGGKTLEERAVMDDPIAESRNVLDPRVAWLITDILSDDAARLEQFGEGGPLSFDFPVAAKTGTTRNSRDNWTVGYTPQRIVGVWVGNADNSPMKGTSGVTGAGPIFHDVMLAAMDGLPRMGFPRPDGIIEREICAVSGKLPTELCTRRVREKFIAGTEPTEPDDIFRRVTVDRRNGLRAGESCPPQFIVEETFAIFPQEVRRWARENGWKEPPQAFSPFCGEDNARGPGSGDGLGENEQSIIITKPSSHDEFELNPLVPDASEKIIFEAEAPHGVTRIEWFVNGTSIGTGMAPDFRVTWKPVAGQWTVEARAGALSAKQAFSVRKKE